MKRRNKLKLNKRLVAALAVLLAVGFAYISSAVNIGGIFTLSPSRYDVHFENLQVTEGSVEADTPTYSTNDTKVSASVRFTQPGDFYEFTIDAVNDGDIDAMLNTVSDVELTEEQEKYLDYKVTYEDGEELAQYQELNAGDRLTFKVRANFKENIDTEDLPVDGDTLDLTFDTEYIRADDNKIRRRAENTLYNVLKEEAESGGLAKKYTGEHQDSIDASLSTKDIFYYYGSNAANKTLINEKNNVIFGGQCWKVYRTTDTGGIRLLYNGEAEAGTCLDSRGTHSGYSEKKDISLSDNYWYGTSYNYDKINKVFSLSGDTEQVTWNNITANSLIGKYTCASTSLDDTCSTLYYTLAKKNETTGIAISINSNAKYYSIGRGPYNINGKSPASVGYMYNTKYPGNSYMLSYNMMDVNFKTSVNTNIWYSDSYSYNSETGKYELINPTKLESIDQYSNLIGKYTLNNSNSAATSTTINYISQSNKNYYYYIEMRNNNNLDYYNYKYTYGDSYTDNGNGTYTINNPTTINRTDYINYYTNITKKYLCINSTNNTCSDMRFINKTSDITIYYRKIENYVKFSSNYTYENGQYILDPTTSTDFDYNIGNKRYTCWNNTGMCEKLSYVYYFYNLVYEMYYYIKIENGKSIDEAINEMFYSDESNEKNSTLKELTDEWYKKHLLNYSDYIDNTIYCNNRNISDYGGLNQNNAINPGKVTFEEKNSSVKLKCENETDSFSHDNNKAYLEYNVGTLPKSEYSIISNGINLSGDTYWTLSPNFYGHTYDDGVVNGFLIARGNSSPTYNMVEDFATIRPSISLKSTAFYTSGDGSTENPYVIYTE